MKITEQQAWIIISAIDTADAERESEEEQELKKEIRKAFPSIDTILTENEKHEYYWSTIVEQDPRVQKKRIELALNPQKKDSKTLLYEFFDLKQKVMDEIYPNKI